jgi:hypothetical protein
MKSMLTLQLKMVNKIAQEKNVRVRLGLYWRTTNIWYFGLRVC